MSFLLPADADALVFDPTSFPINNSPLGGVVGPPATAPAPCAHDTERAIRTKDPLTDCDAECRGIVAINVTGAIGAGKSSVMKDVAAHFDANPQLGIKIVLVEEGADEDKFAWWLDAYINGILSDDGVTRIKVSCGVFQMAVTTLIRGPKRREGRDAARRIAASGDWKHVVILMERAREDARRIFMPANRAMLADDSARRAIFDAESELWHANAVDVGEPLPDATILLTAPLDTIVGRMGSRDREAERGYTDTYPGKVWELYDQARSGWAGGPTHVVNSAVSPPEVCAAVAQVVVDIVRS